MFTIHTNKTTKVLHVVMLPQKFECLVETNSLRTAVLLVVDKRLIRG